MASRIDAVLAAGMARLSVAPDPTGAPLDRNLRSSVNAVVARLEKVAQTSPVTDQQVADALKEIEETVARRHRIPEDQKKKLLPAIRFALKKRQVRDRVAAEAAAAAGAPPPKQQTPAAKLKAAEAALAEELLGPGNGADGAECIHLSPQDRLRVFAFFKGSEREHTLDALASDLGMTADRAARVVRSEQRRIARIVDRERGALERLGAKTYNAVKAYADAQETSALPAMAALRSAGLPPNLSPDYFEYLVQNELNRRETARRERALAICMAPDHSEDAREGTALSLKAAEDLRKPEFQHVLKREKAYATAEKARTVKANPLAPPSQQWLTFARFACQEYDEKFFADLLAQAPAPGQEENEFDALLSNGNGEVQDPLELLLHANDQMPL